MDAANARDGLLGTSIAGTITLPDTPLCRAAAAHAADCYAPFLRTHAHRSFVFAAGAAHTLGKVFDAELLYVACLLHDLGLTDSAPAQTRFEVEGADAALAFLEGRGLEAKQSEVVWDAIALHTTLVIPQRKCPEVALCQLGTAIDVGFAPISLLPPGVLDATLQLFPRLNFKSSMIGALCGLVHRNPHAAAQSTPAAEVGERLVPGFARPHFCDVLASATFES